MRKVICKATGCCRTIDADSGHKYCIEHQALERKDQERKAFWNLKSQWTDMYLSPKWRALRAEKLRESPQCEECGAKATEVHHIQPHEGNLELFYDSGNLQALCHECHERHTQKELRERHRRRKEAERRLWY